MVLGAAQVVRTPGEWERFGAIVCQVIMRSRHVLAHVDSRATRYGMAPLGAGMEVVGVNEEAMKADAFRRLADSHLGDAYRLARLILRDSVEAEDAVHDAFVSAWTKWPTLRDPDRFVPWFDRIVVNTCRNRMRSRWRWNTQSDVEDLSLATEDSSSAVLDRELVGAAFVHLDVDDRIVLALRYYRDLQVDDIAELLDVRPGTVKSRIHRALGRLRTMMQAQGVGGVDG